jgi:hypothetical protein
MNIGSPAPGKVESLSIVFWATAGVQVEVIRQSRRLETSWLIFPDVKRENYRAPVAAKA